MPVRKISAEEMLGGKALVMSANPSIVKGLKMLREAQIQSDSLAVAIDASQQKESGD